MTDKLLIDRALLEHALKALENASDIMDSWAQKRQDDAITTLRAALAPQPSATDHRVVIEQRGGGRLYMNNAEIGPGTLEIRLVGITTVSVTTQHRVLTDADLDAIRKIGREGEKE